MCSKNAVVFDIFIVKNVEKVAFFEYIFEKCTISHDIVDHMRLKTSKTRQISSHLKRFNDIFNIGFGGSDKEFSALGRLLK